MDNDVARQIMRRIDTLEARVMARLDVHDSFRAKFLGGMAVLVFISPFVFEWLRKG